MADYPAEGSSSESASKYDCVVLGAGVIGLSIACELVSHGVKVAVVARELPDDVLSSQWASPWAGANFAFFAISEAERRRDLITYRRLEQVAKERPDAVRRVQATYVWNEGYEEHPAHDIVDNYHHLPPEELLPGFTHGVAFDTYILNPLRYLSYLAAVLRGKGVPILKESVSSLDEAHSVLGQVDCVVNATALGSRTLIGVEDPLVYPVRGQTVTVYAPNIKGVFGNKNPQKDPQQTLYIIPRPGPEGHVTLGGCNIPNEYSTLPDPEVAKRILQQTYELCPALAQGGSSWMDIQVVSHNVGLRPSRKGGLRLELEERVIGQGEEEGLIPRTGRHGKGRKVACVHAYGIGPSGYQSSLGIAEEATELVLGYLHRK